MHETDDNTIRLGIVPYLNVQPLIWSLQHPDADASTPVLIRANTPRLLAEELHRGEHHAAIVPVFEYLLHPLDYTIVRGVSIAAQREVYSVMLFSSCPLEEIRRVHLDISSLTSVNLVRVLLGEMHLNPDLQEAEWQAGNPLSIGEAAVLIGDPAIKERGSHPFQFDLGVLWNDLTGLPFVFAAWLAHSSAREVPLNSLLQRAKNEGLGQIERIASEAGPRFGLPADQALPYFRENLCYDLDERELAGWRRFAELCAKHRIIESEPEFRMHPA